MATIELTRAAYNVLHAAALTKYGAASITTADEQRAADELVNAGLVRHMTVYLRPTPVAAVAATVNGWMAIRATWPDTQYARGSFRPPPPSWIPPVAEHRGGADEQREHDNASGARQHRPDAAGRPKLTEEDRRRIADCVAAAMAKERRATRLDPDDITAAPARPSAPGTALSTRNVVRDGATTDDGRPGDTSEGAEPPSAPSEVRFADLMELLFGEARERLSTVAHRAELHLRTTVNRRAYRDAVSRHKQALSALHAHQSTPNTRAHWMRVWATAQIEIAGCHDSALNGNPLFDHDGRTYSEVRRQCAALADAVADALGVPIGAPRPPAPLHIELAAGAFLNHLPRATAEDLDFNDPNSLLSTTMENLRPACGFAVEVIPGLLGLR